MSEIYSHTALRGIAALLVVLFHYRLTLRPLIDVDRFTGFFDKGYLWVDLFFILSGYILCHVYATRPGQSWREARVFFLARFARIYPLHLATLLFLLLWFVTIPLISNAPAPPINWFTFWLNVFNIHGWVSLAAYDWNFPSWSISGEFAAYLLFPIICIGLMRRPRTTCCALAILMLIRLAYVITFDERAIWERVVLFQALSTFGLGVLLYRWRLIASGLSPAALSAIQVAALALVILNLHFHGSDALTVSLFAVIVLGTRTDTGVLGRILKWTPLQRLGQWSYSIYMLHMPVLYVAVFVWLKLVEIPLSLTPAQSAGALFAFAIAVTLGAGCASYRTFEMPIRAMLKGTRLKPA